MIYMYTLDASGNINNILYNDITTRRDHDIPLGINDMRTAGRVSQLLPPIGLSPANFLKQNSMPMELRDAYSC